MLVFYYRFNPLDRGNLYQMRRRKFYNYCTCSWFQSPRSGKFASDLFTAVTLTKRDKCFNPLDWENLYQMRSINGLTFFVRVKKFQSPRSGKFVSDTTRSVCLRLSFMKLFQSPRSGKFASNTNI